MFRIPLDQDDAPTAVNEPCIIISLSHYAGSGSTTNPYTNFYISSNLLAQDFLNTVYELLEHTTSTIYCITFQ
jgi:hypothetical protein